jgi:hypothetical protein
MQTTLSPKDALFSAIRLYREDRMLTPDEQASLAGLAAQIPPLAWMTVKKEMMFRGYDPELHAINEPSDETILLESWGIE